jgi:N-acetyl-1-D-myo-inositol-2-amino-2-deoxy-alpha-D-glucopyranoside deacetylase
VLVDDLAHLAGDQVDGLGQHRLGELKNAMDILEVTDFIRLGGDGRYRDSGMAYDARGRPIARDVLREGIFWTADQQDAANELVPLIRDRKPQVLITYNPIGGYGHPDHIQAHRIAMYAVLLAGVPSYRRDLGAAWQVPRVLWNTMRRSRMIAGIKALREGRGHRDLEGFRSRGRRHAVGV